MMEHRTRSRALRPALRRAAAPAARAVLAGLVCITVLHGAGALAAEETCTLALVAADPTSGQVGYGILSSSPAGTAEIGGTRAGVGAIAVFGKEAASLTRRGLDFLAQGISVGQAARALSEETSNADRLQVGLVNAAAATSARSGASVLPWKGHLQGTTYAGLASGARGENVILQMGVAFETARGDLADRLLAGLLAGQRVQADHRPIRSAALRVTSAVLPAGTEQQDTATPAAFVPASIDLRVDEHPDPVRELRRLLGVLDARSLHRLGSRPIGQTQGEDVYRVQLMLSDLGIYDGGADGVLNDSTIEAIRAFRRQAGLEDLPVLGTAALRLLLSTYQEWKQRDPGTPQPESSASPVETEILPELLLQPAPGEEPAKESGSSPSTPD